MGENESWLLWIDPNGETTMKEIPDVPGHLANIVSWLDNPAPLASGRVSETVCLYFPDDATAAHNTIASRLCGVADVRGRAMVFGVDGSLERGMTRAERDLVLRRLKTGEAPPESGPVQVPRDLTVGGHAAIQAGDGSQLMFVRMFAEAPGGAYATIEAAEKAVEIWERDPEPLRELLDQMMDAAERSGLMVPLPLTVEDLENIDGA
ncbi:hypothetical protein [Streptomyces sp. NBC_00470]|uniref:hypothetical protein n=1 Tax=Streptomyces sp. NBC_00470 TaxID=2975753 RepID=UPI0030E3F228